MLNRCLEAKGSWNRCGVSTWTSDAFLGTRSYAPKMTKKLPVVVDTFFFPKFPKKYGKDGLTRIWWILSLMVVAYIANDHIRPNVIMFP